MERESRAIYEAAVELPEAQRVRLIRHLLDSLADPDEFWEEELAAELNRRHREIQDGTAKPIPWSDLKDQLSP